ncbi:dTDP-4-amino-4,6-dideoxygalactose transaminase [Chromobacterium violaceum]|uniref:dTDP-4-amino-4,6-dideoxygalactose transaminase n=1 Tax=Chromobacterium violaceum TaxID=536 RepID=UPI003DA8BFA0
MINFNVPYLTGEERKYIDDAFIRNTLSGDGHYTKLCHEWLVDNLGTKSALLTHSCTAALEMAALLLDLKAGDEVIVPSFTFVSSASAFVLRGAVPVFVDIRPDTLNIDEELIEKSITEKTKAILVMHYAGVPCEMDAILSVAKKHNLFVIEDAAQALLSKYKGKYLGTIGDIGCLSFHATKNIIAGEGGAILLNNPIFIERAEIIREKGTNRKQFFRGETDKYTWVDIGSSYLPSELNAAFLYAQLTHAKTLTERRLSAWNQYYETLSSKDVILERLSLPSAAKESEHNAHIFSLILKDMAKRDFLLAYLKQNGIGATFHYVPLHSSDAGIRFGRVGSPVAVTDRIAHSLIRLPMWIGVENHIDEIVNKIADFFEQN